MSFQRISFGPFLVTALLLMTGGLYYTTSAVTAQEKQSNTSNTEASKTPTGFPTGTKCTKTGTYKASNQYLELIITLEEGDEFPIFPDGQKTIWYPLTPSTKSGFEPIKAAPGTN